MKLSDLVTLSEGPLTFSNMKDRAGPEPEKLTSTDEFKLLQHADPDFGKKLLDAWVGDAKEHGRGKQDFLFPRLVSEEGVKKMAPGLHLTTDMRKALKTLASFHQLSFSTKSGYKPTTDEKFGHERYSRDQGFSSLQFT